MKQGYFSEITQSYSKNGVTGVTGVTSTNADSQNKDLSLGCSVTPAKSQGVTGVTNGSERQNLNPSVTLVTPLKKQGVTDGSTQDASNDGVSSDALHLLHLSHQKKDNFVNAPPRPTGKHQGWSWGEWNGWIVGASETERAEALEAMPDNWRHHIQKHLDSVNLLRKRAEGRA